MLEETVEIKEMAKKRKRTPAMKCEDTTWMAKLPI